ncbi:FAD-dependent oxidoreductase [Streptomyces sp. NPDC056669]|uniref:FAD-dependent oxidoreductase n=1 Tax=Streptomyces sp. NPDC056669 TaxID=3345903 RepID=UPI0036AAF3C4
MGTTNRNLRADVLVLGFGKGGKTVAATLGRLGWRVVMVERSAKMYGGTCPNVGCVPSKAADHIDAVQRLQAVLLEPARAAVEQHRPRSWLTGHVPGHACGHTGAPAAEVEGGYGRA